MDESLEIFDTLNELENILPAQLENCVLYFILAKENIFQNRKKLSLVNTLMHQTGENILHKGCQISNNMTNTDSMPNIFCN